MKVLIFTPESSRNFRLRIRPSFSMLLEWPTSLLWEDNNCIHIVSLITYQKICNHVFHQLNKISPVPTEHRPHFHFVYPSRSSSHILHCVLDCLPSYPPRGQHDPLFSGFGQHRTGCSRFNMFVCHTDKILRLEVLHNAQIKYSK